MRFIHNDLRMGISAGACIVLALMLLVLPLQWILAAIMAAAFHESCHIAAVYLCGGRIRRCRIGSRGALLEAEALSPGRELICLLAGPLGSLLLLFFIRWIPRTAVCAAFHCAYNLLPLRGLDGGAALCRVSQFLFPGHCQTICLWAQRICLGLLWLLAIYAALGLGLGLVPLAAVFALHMRTKWKNPLQTLRREGTMVHSFR